MNFLDRLDKVIAEQEQSLDVPRTDAIKTQKTLIDFGRVADKASNSLEDLKRALELSGLDKIETILPFMEQLTNLSTGLKKDGELRKNIENILSVSRMISSK